MKQELIITAPVANENRDNPMPFVTDTAARAAWPATAELIEGPHPVPTPDEFANYDPEQYTCYEARFLVDVRDTGDVA